MTRLIALLVLAATPSEPTLDQRKRFAEAHRMKLTFDWKRSSDECQKVVAPSALGCKTPVWLCTQAWSSGMCDGSFSESRGITFELHEPSEAEVDAAPLPELILESESGDDCPECECTDDSGIGFGPGFTEAEKESARRAFEKQRAREHAKCVSDAAKRQKAERTKRMCTLLMVDPCRREAFIRCTGKNGNEDDPPLGKTLVFSYASQPDGGAPLGGEWEPRD